MRSTRDLPATSILCLLVACGGATSGTGGGGAGDPGGTTEAPPGSCSLAAGTYTEHLTVESGGSSCPAIPDQTVTMDGSETFGGGGSSAPADGGPGCTTDFDASTCALTTAGTTSESGFTSRLSMTITYAGTSASGQETITEAAPGQPSTSCTYGVTMTRS